MGYNVRIIAVYQTMRQQSFLVQQAVMGDHFGEGERVHSVFPFTAGQRFVDLVGQIER